jgi:hypothetical protein
MRWESRRISFKMVSLFTGLEPIDYEIANLSGKFIDGNRPRHGYSAVRP